MAKRQRRKRQERRQEHAKRQGWQTRHSVITGVGLAAGAALGMTSAAQADTFYVASKLDTTGAVDCANDANIDCTLRQAIVDANANPDHDSIYFLSGITGTITLGSQLSITNPVGIYGPGPDVLTVSGNHASRVFNVDPATTGDYVGIFGLTVANGQTAGNGGGIFNSDAHLVLFDTVVTGNTAAIGGGGIYESGDNNDGQDFYMGYSTVRGNTAASGAGLYGPLFLGDEGSAYGVHNSTFSGNHATGGTGGALYAGDIAFLTDSTVSGNTATSSGGGVSAGGDGVGFYNSIASGNSAPVGPDSDSYLYAGASLVQSSSAPVHTIPGYANIIGQSAQLGTLANNGGPTPTMRPLATSPVIDQGFAAGDSDQRFFDRPVDIPGVPNAPFDASDMGAVELTLAEGKQATPPTPTPTPTLTPTPIQHKKCKKKKHHKRSAESTKKKKCKKKKKRSAAHTSAFGGPGQHWPDGAGQHPFRLGR
jgi:predicted outer membrane repeat protein